MKSTSRKKYEAAAMAFSIAKKNRDCARKAWADERIAAAFDQCGIVPGATVIVTHAHTWQSVIGARIIVLGGRVGCEWADRDGRVTPESNICIRVEGYYLTAKAKQGKTFMSSAIRNVSVIGTWDGGKYYPSEVTK